MTWDFAWRRICLSSSSGGWLSLWKTTLKALDGIPSKATGTACQRSVTDAANDVTSPLVSTDPPYYDNIGYADLVDFFVGIIVLS